jgi:tryptophan 2,3-dioxygenase
MIKGMEREQFLRYRMALLPASGFQSAQYRMIEFYATPLENLVHSTQRDTFSSENTIEELFEQVYWKKGATDLATGEKTLTLKQFEVRYTPRLLRIANAVKNSTIYHKYLQLPEVSRNNEELISALKELDMNANVNWPLMHMGSAHRYLAKEGKDVEATGGTNWKEYLPPSFQKIIFFPTLYSDYELDTWGKQWVDHIFNPANVEYKE